ncbi:hypothetical protein BV22DRAFT_1133226 [Leucogyrophana mollusca]|uniref:Uncharacterized protein n=1 Tax=Leucogyrophana mollusca TaxID=85980 RepID=A0ACB8B596_9AGAM|nr:hypothetical protein BV22DRAFT_1133226 [Leucogyrophana mollusca]
MAIGFTAISQWQTQKTLRYFNVAGLAVLIFDYCITFESETRWVWGRKWDTTRIAFTISRYLPFVGAGMTTYGKSILSSETSTGLAENVLHFLSIVAAEVLLIIRTYAFWKCSKRLLVGLTVYGIVTIAGALTANLDGNILVSRREALFRGTATETAGYYEATSSRNSALVYAFLLAYELVLLCLMVYMKYHDYRNYSSSIVTTVYRGAVGYIMCIIAVTMANVIIDAHFPIQCSNMLDVPQLVIHSILASRILFDLRESDQRANDASMPMVMSSLHFKPRSIEND